MKIQLTTLFTLILCLQASLYSMHPTRGQLSIPLTRDGEAAHALAIADIKAHAAAQQVAAGAETKQRAEGAKFEWLAQDNKTKLDEAESDVPDTTANKHKNKFMWDDAFACTGLLDTLQDTVKEYLTDPLEYFPAIVTKGIITNTSNVAEVALTPDGNIIMRGDQYNYLIGRAIDIIDGKTLQIVSRLQYHSSAVFCMPNGHIITDSLSVGGATESLLHVWNPATNVSIALTDDRGRHSGARSCLRVTPNNTVVIGYRDGMVQLWDPYSNTIKNLNSHTGYINAITLAPNGNIVTASDDHTIRIWDQESGACIKVLAGQTKVLDIGMLPDGRLISIGGNARIWDLKTGEHSDTSILSAKKLLMTKDHIITTTGSSISVYDITTQTSLQYFRTGSHEDLWRCAIGLQGHLITHDRNHKDGISVKVWDQNNGACLVAIPSDFGHQFCIAVNDTMLVVKLSSEIHVYQLNPAAMAELKSLSLMQLAELKEFIKNLDMTTSKNFSESQRKKLEKPIMLKGKIAKEFMALPEHIRGCLASYYQVTTPEIEEQYNSLGGTVCTIL